ncbi:hypothetical protein [Laspinema olomoucense]|uniref:Uncharacterized protein n=1 Tax=Laspinema olomoucense D3b TaxID=2953688 RepID=A0ABT2N427_9CYAN|nr:hypothetical protein [Laspinema sp. D3b]MCT7977418.1 hypothetical protein [Laspinema sp. D3b]
MPRVARWVRNRVSSPHLWQFAAILGRKPVWSLGLETGFLHPICGNLQQFWAETGFLVRSPQDFPRTTVR